MWHVARYTMHYVLLCCCYNFLYFNWYFIADETVEEKQSIMNWRMIQNYRFFLIIRFCAFVKSPLISSNHLISSMELKRKRILQCNSVGFCPQTTRRYLLRLRLWDWDWGENAEEQQWDWKSDHLPGPECCDRDCLSEIWIVFQWKCDKPISNYKKLL